MSESRISKLLAGTALAALVGPMAAQAAEQVGVVTLANPDTYTQPPGANEGPASMGDPVVMEQRFRTDADGQAHLLFEDKSNITIGPNSEMTIDEFVYDPEGGLGKAVLSTTTGVFRFVGGQISKQQEVTVETPYATLGIRGGMFGWGVLPSDNTFLVFFFYGDLLNVVTSNGEIQALQPGNVIAITRDAAGRAVIKPATPEQIAEFLAQLEGMGPPYDPQAANFGGAFAPGLGGFSDNLALRRLYQLLLAQGLGILTFEELEEYFGYPDTDYERMRDVLKDLTGAGSGGFNLNLNEF